MEPARQHQRKQFGFRRWAFATIGFFCLALQVTASACSSSGFEPNAPFEILAPIPGLAPGEYGLIDVNGGRLYYEMYGEGEPLLLIPGLSDNHTAWNEDVPEFVDELRVILYDPRGTGQSSSLDSSVFSTADMAEDAAAILQALSIERAHVYGVSMGGMVAQELALRYPTLVGALVLGATAAQGSNSEVPAHWARSTLLVDSDSESELREVLSAESADDIRGLADDFIESLELEVDYPSTSPAVIATQLAAAAEHDVLDRLNTLASPTLILHGTDDGVIAPENSDILAQEIPNARLVLLEGVGHFFRAESDEASRTVLEFLRHHRLAD